MQARDFYDIWYLLEIAGLDVKFLINEFRAKCKSKKVNPYGFPAKIEFRLPQYRGRWENSLSDQIKDLPDFDNVQRDVMRQLKNLPLR